jgi:DNA ligase D-like protein (predicted polymerase)
MASRKEILDIGGREVTISNPDKVYFPQAGHTKLDVVRFFLAVADGALTGVRGRPMALKRFVDGIDHEPFFQKRAPENRPEWMRTATLTFPSGRTADEIVVDEAAGLAWVVNLGCVDLNPHPVRADDLDHPDELRVDLDPVPGVPFSQVREVAMVTREALESVGLVGWPKTSGSRGIHVNVRIEPRWTYPQVRRAALALARDVEQRAPQIATSKWWKEERHGVFLDYNQNAKDRTVASAYSVRPTPDARVSAPLTWDELPDAELGAFTLVTMPERYARIGDPGAGIDDAVGSLEGLLELSGRHEKEGLGDAPWPPNYAKQAGEPPRVQPSRKRRADSEYEGRGVDGGPPPEVAAERAAAVASGDPNAGLPTEWPGSGAAGGAWPGARTAAWAGTRPTPTGRRRSTVPVIEISRAKAKSEALAGLERWKERHRTVVPFLEPADVLVDGMRGRSSLWYRVRVNLTHVPEADRPAQEALDPDYDPMTEWVPSSPATAGSADDGADDASASESKVASKPSKKVRSRSKTKPGGS